MITFVIYRNQSFSQNGNSLFFLAMCCVSFTIALVFARQGLWLIIPFAGAEMLALGLALYCCVYRLSCVETVTVSDKEVTVSVCKGNKEQSSCSFPKAWARAAVIPASSLLREQQLWLRARQLRIEIGAFLSEREKHRLANAINRAILNMK